MVDIRRSGQSRLTAGICRNPRS